MTEPNGELCQRCGRRVTMLLTHDCKGFDLMNTDHERRLAQIEAWIVNNARPHPICTGDEWCEVRVKGDLVAIFLDKERAREWVREHHLNEEWNIVRSMQPPMAVEKIKSLTLEVNMLRSELATRTRERDEAMADYDSVQKEFCRVQEVRNNAERKLKIAVAALEKVCGQHDDRPESDCECCMAASACHKALREIDGEGGEQERDAKPDKPVVALSGADGPEPVSAPPSPLPDSIVKARKATDKVLPCCGKTGGSSMCNAEGHDNIRRERTASDAALHDAQAKLAAVEKLESLNEDGYENTIRELKAQLAAERNQTEVWREMAARNGREASRLAAEIERLRGVITRPGEEKNP